MIVEKSRRTERISSIFHEELTKLLQIEMDDIRFKTLTVTRVNVSPDLSQANVYISCGDENQSKEIIKELRTMVKKLRYELAQRIDVRKMPQLKFFYDAISKKGEHIISVLQKIAEMEKVGN
jgi:ribosome-binding factor A